LTEADLQKLLRQAGYNAPHDLPGKLRAIFTVEQLHQPAAVEAAMGQVVSAIVRTMTATLTAIRELERTLDEHFGQHPDRTSEDREHMMSAIMKFPRLEGFAIT
jgi:hypothetical protein